MLVRAGALGDLLLLRRAIASLGAQGASVGLVAPVAGQVLQGEGQGEVREVLPWEHRAFSRMAGGEAPDDGTLGDRLRAYEAAIAYTANDAFVAALQDLIPLVRALDPKSLEPGTHASETLARPALALGGLPGVDPPLLGVSGTTRAEADEWLRRLGGPGFLALHPGSGSRRKNWPSERFAELAESLAPDRPFLVAEGPADETAVGPLRGRAGVVIARGLPLRTLGALLADASLYVGNDSGVSHLAAACGAPTLALFGPTPASLWAPVGPRVRVVEAPGGEMSGLATTTVVAAAQDALRSWERAALPSG